MWQIKSVYMGIDPGKEGGICFLYESGAIETFATPKHVNDSIDWRGLGNLIRDKEPFIEMIAYEQLHAISGASARSTYAFGSSNGGLDSLIENSLIPFVKVQPKEWQKYAFKGLTTVYEKGGTKVDTKTMSAMAAARLAPAHDFVDRIKNPKKKLADNGLTDAFLIAWWLKNEYLRK